MTPCEMDDLEFEEVLEPVYEAWERGFDTMDIAELCKISEAKADYVLTCYLGGKFWQMEEARYALRRWPDFRPELYLPTFESEAAE
jgi:hypothetical protein